jgi:hypothetical protein
MALSPIPVIGTAKNVSLSALAGLVTVSVAPRGNGQYSGEAPRMDCGFPDCANGDCLLYASIRSPRP